MSNLKKSKIVYTQKLIFITLKQIKKVRIKAKLTQKQVEKKLNFSSGYICKLEKGSIKRPFKFRVKKIEKLFGVKICE